MRNYFQRESVKKSIINFAYSGSPDPLRESAFYSERIDGIQRHSPRSDSIFVLDSEEAYYEALRSGAKAFYSSFWRYSNPKNPDEVTGRDLVWTLKAEDGGIPLAKKIAKLFVGSLREEGFSNPLVKYSGKLGFDVMIPLENVQTGSPNDLDFLSKVQENLSKSALDYLRSEGSFDVVEDNSEIKLKGRMGTCLLTELRWRRGLLLAPMSLHPSSGLVSLPLKPSEISDFSVVDASPENARSREWFEPRPILAETSSGVKTAQTKLPVKA